MQPCLRAVGSLSRGVGRALSKPGALSANAVSVGADVRVDCVIGMAGGARGSRRVPGCDGFATQEVFTARDGFKVRRIYTRWIPAQVVELQAVRDGAVCQLPSGYVSKKHRRASPAICNLPVTLGAFRREPEPTIIRGTPVYLWPEPIRKRLKSPQHGDIIAQSIY